MNMVRIPGTGAYESPAFHDLCDELGILVWQDFMFANFDYPDADEEFLAAVERRGRRSAGGARRPAEPRRALRLQRGRAAGGDARARSRRSAAGPLFGELLPAAIGRGRRRRDLRALGALRRRSARSGPTAASPTTSGSAATAARSTDARLARVRFAAECLAFANVPEPAGVEAVLPGAPADVVVHHPRWKAGVPRDAGTGWDFDDVRDHYLRELFGVDPAELRRHDHERYLELSRAVTGEVMGAVFGEWRRAGSPCGGGLVLWLRDLVPGAGWGLLDHSGAPKPAYHPLRRALAPVAVWITDEGLGGVGVHVANDGPRPLRATLRVAVYGADERLAAEARQAVSLDAHSAVSQDLESMLGRFLDASWAYRFGPAPTALAATLVEDGADEALAAPAFLFPGGPPLTAATPERLGLVAAARATATGATLELTAAGVVYGVRVQGAGLCATDDSFSLEPGRTRRLELRAVEGRAAGPISIEAINLVGRLSAAVETPA